MFGTSYSKRWRLIAAVTAILVGPLASAHGQTLQKISLGVGDKSMSPLNVDKVLPEYLGYYKQEGLTLDFVAAGSNAAVSAGLFANRLQFGVGLANFQLPPMAKGEKLPGIDFFESAYPFKSAMVVSPNSPIKTIADLKGKRIGVSSFGISNQAIAKVILQLAGIDPDKDVSWLAVGEGTIGGIALQRGDIDVLMHFKTSLGDIEAAGIPMRYLSLPDNTPMIGGSFMVVPPALINQHRDWIVGFGRGMAKGHVFIQANPAAAAYIYTQMYPELLPPGKTPPEQMNSVLVSIAKLRPLSSYDAKDPMGYMKDSEWQEELKFNNIPAGKIDLKDVYTNDLIKDINDFDHEKIRQEALNFKIPYKN